MLSLSGAPLTRIDRDGRRIPLQRLLDFVGLRLEPVYGFRSLFAFKAKFQPEYQPIFMAYPDAAALPRIGSAVAHAYLPHMTLRQTLLLVRTMLTHGPRKPLTRAHSVSSDALRPAVRVAPGDPRCDARRRSPLRRHP
jgi:phosphatidylglycerol lysyltransferase